MKHIKGYLIRHKSLVLFLLVVSLTAFPLGCYLGIANISTIKEQVLSYTSFNVNFIFIHFTLLFLSIALSFIGIGIPLLIVLFFYEVMSFGFLLSIFSLSYFVKGTLYSFILTFITKGVYILLLFFLISKCLKIAILMTLKYSHRSYSNKEVHFLLKGCFLLLFFCLFYDTFLFFFGSKILSIFSFLLT